MKAAVYTGYGPPHVLQIRDVEEPVPRETEVLLRVRAAAANPLDWRFMRGKPFVFRLVLGMPAPRLRPGRDVAGEVIAVGTAVTRFRVGNQVFGTCGGSFAEVACAPERGLALKPPNISFEEAAAVPIAGLTALQGLRDHGKLRAGQQVLVNGAAGGVGTFAVQIAKAFGAEVTAVCSTGNLELVRSIGADRAIDYTREDFTRGDQRYDVLFDAVGNRSAADLRRVTKPQGVCVIAGAPKRTSELLKGMLETLWMSLLPGPKLAPFVAKGSSNDLEALHDLMASGEVKPVVDRRYRLSEIAAAIGYLEQGHARGKVVITMEPAPHA